MSYLTMAVNQREDDLILLLIAALSRAGIDLFLEPEDRWYRLDNVETGNRQFIVADPDSYLLRFFQHLGERPFSGP